MVEKSGYLMFYQAAEKDRVCEVSNAPLLGFLTD